jgi:enoyl-CoA hydratase/carnithine racemase
MTREAGVLYEAHGGVARITFNRPHVLNAGDPGWVADFERAFERLAADGGIRVAVLTGAGRAFSTGLDLHALADGELRLEHLVRWESVMTAIERLDCLTIAAINGHCIGGGLQIALVCDYRLASDTARVGLPAVRECLIPSMAVYRLPRLIGAGRAAELIITGELITAERAEAIGLVNKVVKPADYESAVAETIERFLAVPTSSARACKRLLHGAFDLPFDEFRAAMQAELGGCLASDEHRAAMAVIRQERSARPRR